MTDEAPRVVLVPYARFLECQQRRREISAELTRRDRVSSDEPGEPAHSDALPAARAVAPLAPADDPLAPALS